MTIDSIPGVVLLLSVIVCLLMGADGLPH